MDNQRAIQIAELSSRLMQLDATTLSEQQLQQRNNMIFKLKEEIKMLDEASLATMRDYFAGDENARDPMKITQQRLHFAKDKNAKPTVDKRFRSPEEYQQWLKQNKLKQISTAESAEEIEEVKQRLDPKCWDGYKKQGTKMKGGVRVNNCVKEDSLEEYGDTAQGQKMLTKIQKRAVDRVVSKKADTDPKYAKKNSDTAKRAWDRMTDLEETYDGDDGEEFNPNLAKMAYDEGVVKGASLADGATLERAMAINDWDKHDGGIYKQHFAKGFKAGRIDKIRHNNKQYNLNLKLMKDGSIRHGEQGVAEEKQRLDPKCWDGYKKQGTKIKGGVRVNNCVPESAEQGIVEGSDNITAVFSGYGNYMNGRGANVFKHYGITILDKQYNEDEDIAEYTVSGSKAALDQARAYLERSDQFGGMILKQGVAEGYDDEEHPIHDDSNEGRPGKQRYPGQFKKPSPKLTPVEMKKTDPVSEEINKEAYERLQKVFAFKNYES